MVLTHIHAQPFLSPPRCHHPLVVQICTAASFHKMLITRQTSALLSPKLSIALTHICVLCSISCCLWLALSFWLLRLVMCCQLQDEAESVRQTCTQQICFEHTKFKDHHFTLRLFSSTQQQMSPSCNDVSGKKLQPRRQRRTQVPDKPNYSLNLWSIMKNCIGKELSKIPMPVSVLRTLLLAFSLTQMCVSHVLLIRPFRWTSTSLCPCCSASPRTWSTTSSWTRRRAATPPWSRCA